MCVSKRKESYQFVGNWLIFHLYEQCMNANREKVHSSCSLCSSDGNLCILTRSIQSAHKRNNNAPVQMTYQIFPRILESVGRFCPFGTNFKALNLQRDRFNHYDPSTLSKYFTEGFPPAPLMSFQPRIYGILTLGIPYTQSKHVCPGYSKGFSFCLEYANEQFRPCCLLSFLVLVISSVSVFHPVCLSSLFICFRAQNDPRSVSGLSFLVPLPVILRLVLCVVSKCTLFSPYSGR